MKPHVLLVVNSYVTPQDPRAGEKFRLQVDALLDAGWQVGLIAIAQRQSGRQQRSTKGYGLISREQHRDALMFRDHTYRRVLSPLRTPQHIGARLAARCLSRYVGVAGRPDIVHAHGLCYAGFTALEIKRRHGIPFVLTEHMSRFLTPSRVRPLADRYTDILNAAAARLPVSDQLGAALEAEFGAAFRPWQSVPNMIDSEFLLPLVAPPSDFTFLTVGRLEPVKGYELLLRAFAARFRNQPVRLVIGGMGALADELQRLTTALGIGAQVSFPGWLKRHEILESLQRCSAYVMSSHQETFGLPLIEAFACGRPVIATACGGPQSLVTDSNGILVPPGDTAALAEAMWQMYRGCKAYDADKIQQDCRAQFAPPAVVSRLDGIYRAAMAS